VIGLDGVGQCPVAAIGDFPGHRLGFTLVPLEPFLSVPLLGITERYPLKADPLGIGPCTRTPT
jgi:hypothetical protein